MKSIENLHLESTDSSVKITLADEIKEIEKETTQPKNTTESVLLSRSDSQPKNTTESILLSSSNSKPDERAYDTNATQKRTRAET